MHHRVFLVYKLVELVVLLDIFAVKVLTNFLVLRLQVRHGLVRAVLPRLGVRRQTLLHAVECHVLILPVSCEQVVDISRYGLG